MRFPGYLLIYFFSLSALLACKSNTVNTQPAVDVSNPNGTSASLILIDIWALEAIDGRPINTAHYPQARPRLEFNSEGRVGGNSGCNEISSTYTTDGVKISFGPIIATRMACPGPGEREFLKALKPEMNFRIENLKLYLLDGGKEKLQFKKVD
jgi:heat shock protein HslJ